MLFAYDLRSLGNAQKDEKGAITKCRFKVIRLKNYITKLILWKRQENSA